MTMRHDLYDDSDGPDQPIEVIDTIPRAAWTVAAMIIAAGAAAWALSVFHMVF